jgi:hypothetical protein
MPVVLAGVCAYWGLRFVLSAWRWLGPSLETRVAPSSRARSWFVHGAIAISCWAVFEMLFDFGLGVSEAGVVSGLLWFLLERRRRRRPQRPPGIAPLAVLAVADTNRLDLTAQRRLRSSHPADHLAAQQAVAAIAAIAGVPSPDCVWVRSPREAYLAQMAADSYLRRDGLTAGARWAEVARRPPTQAAPAEWKRLVERLAPLTHARGLDDVAAVEAALVDWSRPLSEHVSDRLAKSAGELQFMLRWRIGPGIQSVLSVIAAALVDDGFADASVRSAPTGLPVDLQRLAAEEELARVAHDRLRPLTTALAALIDSAGGWWPTPLGVILSERPTAIRIDRADALHATDGPAMEYADGWSVWALHGASVTRQTVLSPETLQVEAIQAVEDEPRRAAMRGEFGRVRYVGAVAESAARIANEPSVTFAHNALVMFGEERFVRDRGQAIDHDLDAIGLPRTLWRADRRGDDPVVMVEVVNSTANPGGSRHHYFLRVRPEHRTCKVAVAWTFGLSDATYAPLIES